MAGGRPTKYTKEKAQEIADCIAQGMTVNQASKETGISTAVIYAWNSKNPEFQELFARARDTAADAISFQAIEIADDLEIEPAHKRVMVDTRLRILGKWSNRYSEKHSVDHTSKGEKLSSPSQMTDEQLLQLINKAKD